MMHSHLKAFALVIPSFWNVLPLSFLCCHLLIQCSASRKLARTVYLKQCFPSCFMSWDTQKNGICLAWHKGEPTDLAGLPVILKARVPISPFPWNPFRVPRITSWDALAFILQLLVSKHYYTLKSRNSGSIFKYVPFVSTFLESRMKMTASKFPGILWERRDQVI